VLRGWIEERCGRYADAMPHYRKALEVSPKYPFAMMRLGNMLAETGELAQAIEWLEKAVAHRPGMLEAHFDLAHLLRRGSRAEEAEREARIHRLLNQTSDNTANTKESVLEKLAAYEELETLLPQWIEGRLALAQMRLRLGRVELALERLRSLVAEHPESSEAKALLEQVERQARSGGRR
jgi:tetratricopeptide (TPR) repeat protein